MSYKSQLYPASRASETPLRERISHSWGSVPANLEDMKFLRSWLIYDSKIGNSQIRPVVVPRRLNWKTLLALTLATAVSAGLWVGIGLIFAQAWK